MGISGALYISEFLGAILMFVGFMRAIKPMSVFLEENRNIYYHG
jgi:hypothetical protein